MTQGEMTTPAVFESNISYLDSLGAHTFIVDPGRQGYGLDGSDWSDSYANKFFILTNKQGVFVSPKQIPGELLDYYSDIGIAVATADNIITSETHEGSGSLVERLHAHPEAQALLASRRGSIIVPYMMTPETESFADRYGLSKLVDAAATSALADKARLYSELLPIVGDIAEHTGFDIVIPAATFQTGDQAATCETYRELSQNGRKDVVAVKPRSAAGLGIFVVSASEGADGLDKVLKEHFEDGEEVLLEAHVRHDHSPSMQGVAIDDTYQHLFFNNQVISQYDGRIVYNANQMPFGPTTVDIDPYDLTRVQKMHEALGETFIAKRGIGAVAGFDVLLRVADGAVLDAKLTEVNMHIPSCMSLYAAIAKVFPGGFKGVAHAKSVALRADQTPADFLRHQEDYLVTQKGTHGIFPVNLSFSDKVDVVLFAPSIPSLGRLQYAVRQRQGFTR